MKFLALILLLTTASAAPLCTPNTGQEKWPAWNPGTTYALEVTNGLKALKAMNQPYYYYAPKGGHKPTGNYMNFEMHRTYKDGPTVQIDPQGLPKIKYGDEFYYNPVTISQYALGRYARAINPAIKPETVSFEEQFRIALDYIVRSQSKDGAWRYELPFMNYEPGWVSGMQQGMGMSVYARAYALTRNPEYLKLGDAALNFMLRDVKDGGVRTTLAEIDPSLGGYIWFEEYPNNHLKDGKPNVSGDHALTHTAYTLNGYMFALVGLYDWSMTTTDPKSKVLASEAFNCGIESLIKVFPYYDVGGYTSYDLRQLFGGKPLTNSYHLVHIYLIRALRQITNRPELMSAERLLIMETAPLNYTIPKAFEYVLKE